MTSRWSWDSHLREAEEIFQAAFEGEEDYVGKEREDDEKDAPMENPAYKAILAGGPVGEGDDRMLLGEGEDCYVAVEYGVGKHADMTIAVAHNGEAKTVYLDPGALAFVISGLVDMGLVERLEPPADDD